jgi:hypothetical protein
MPLPRNELVSQAAGGNRTTPEVSRRRERWPLAAAWKPDLEQCMDRVQAWFEQQVIDRPPVRFHRHNAEYERGNSLDPKRWPTLKERWFDVDYQLDCFEKASGAAAFQAETFPVFWPNLGPNAYAAFYAGALHFDEVTSWYEPVLGGLDDLGILQTDPLQSAYFKKLEELTRAALERSQGCYFVGYTDLHPSLDCIAAWRGATALCLDLAESPEQLAPLVDLSVRDFHRIFDHFDALLKEWNQPSVTWMGIPSCGKLHIPSCDFASMIRPSHFEAFSVPQLRRELVGMDHVIYHLDGKGVARHLETLLAFPEIQAIQWVQGVGEDAPILQWLPLLKRIQAAGKSIIVDLQLSELEAFIGAMRPEGVFLCLGTDEGGEQPVLDRLLRWR